MILWIYNIFFAIIILQLVVGTPRTPRTPKTSKLKNSTSKTTPRTPRRASSRSRSNSQGSSSTTNASKMDVVERFIFLVDSAVNPIPGLSQFDLISFVGRPLNLFMVQELLETEPELIQPYLKFTLMEWPQFKLNPTMLNLSQRHISGKMMHSLIKKERLLKSNSPLTGEEYLFGINDSVFIGVCTQEQRTLIEADYLNAVEVDGNYILVPDLPMILYNWFIKHKAGKDRAIEASLISFRFPTWFVALSRMIYKIEDDGDHFLQDVNHHIVEMISEPASRTLLEYFIRKKVLGRPSWNPLGLIWPEQMYTVDESFIVMAACAHIDPDLLDDLINKYKSILTPSAIMELRFLNSLAMI